MLTTGLWLLAGSLILLVIILLILLWHFLRSRSKLKSSEQVNVSEESVCEESTCKKMSIKEIYVATDNLSPLNFIGQGIAGKVYKGVLANGRHVAVKHIIKDEDAETFMREVTSLLHVKHPNLVMLRGYCEEEDECFLVYELCINGNLSEWLFGKDKTLSWIQRLQIALDSACGLWFLHIYPGGCIVHRDIKRLSISPLKLAIACTRHKQQRPSMEQVVTRLEEALKISTRAC